MKIIFSLLKNPIVKIIGVAAIIYFGLLQHKENPESLGYRLSKENVSKNFEEAKERGQFIISTIREVQNVKDGTLPAESLSEKVSGKIIYDDLSVIKIEDVIKGVGEDELKCSNQAKISYKIFIKENNVELDSIENFVLIIGSHKNNLLENKIVGMKKNGERKILIPRSFKSSDTKLSSLLKFNEVDLYYLVQLHDFTKSLENIKCN